MRSPYERNSGGLHFRYTSLVFVGRPRRSVLDGAGQDVSGSSEAFRPMP